MENKSMFNCVVFIFVAILMIIFVILLNGYVVCYIWNNFISVHFGIATIKLTEAIILLTLKSLLTNDYAPREKDTKMSARETLVIESFRLLSKPLFGFLIVYFILNFFK